MSPLRRPLHGPERLVHLGGHPESVEQHRELARDCHDRPLLGSLATLSDEPQAEAPELRVRSKGPQRVVGGFDQQPPYELVTPLGDGELGPRLARLALARREPEIRAPTSRLRAKRPGSSIVST